jgi:simple sugar transport system substrate-binding protein
MRTNVHANGTASAKDRALAGKRRCRDHGTSRGNQTMISRSVSRFAVAAALSASVLAMGSARAAGIAGAPAPFDQGGVKIALVGLISAGDFFEAVQAGAQKQAKALGVDLRIFPGHNDPAEQRNQVEQAINLGVKAIIIDHGHPEALKDVAQEALDKGIKVVAFDVNLDNPKIPQIEQSDHDLASVVIDQALADNGKTFQAGYVYVSGFAPLDRRDEVWKAVKQANPGIVEKAHFGAVDATTATTVADQAKAALRANPGISVIVAPYDEFARGSKLAVKELGLGDKIKIYSADVSTADIGEITEDGSPWVATAATNPAVIGAVSVRAAALLVAGQDPGHTIVVKPTLLTRTALLAGGIKTVEDLNAKLPAFGHSDAATAAWIPEAK